MSRNGKGMRNKGFTLIELLACQLESRSHLESGRRQVQAAFTLLELLVVIAIIAILAGLLLPALNIARQYAWRARAKEDVDELVTAWSVYLFDYRKFPDIEINEMDTNTVAILSGSNTNHNPRATYYMEFMNKEITNGFRDHWGSVYQVALDNGEPPHDATAAYDGWVTPANTNEPVAKSVAAWSKGKNIEDDTDDIISWY